MVGQAFHCVFINLDRSPDRRFEIEAELKAAGVEAERIAAVDARGGFADADIAYSSKKRRWVGAPLGAGEIACAESHRRALRRIVESGAAFGVVLEDDAVLAPGFREAVVALTTDTAGWESVRLEWRKRGVMLDTGVEAGRGRLVIPRNMTYGSTAMLFSRTGAAAALRALDAGYSQTVDVVYGSLCGPGFGYFQLSPEIASERPGESLIQTRPMDGGAERSSSHRNRVQEQGNGIYRGWMSLRRRLSAQPNAARLKRETGKLREAPLAGVLHDA